MGDSVMAMRWFRHLAGQGSFLRSVLVLVGGTAGAQLVMAAAMPVLSRLYSPADFGQLAVFTGVVSTLGVAACLRWDIAIALPETESDAFGLLALSFVSAVILSLLVFLTVSLIPGTIAAWLGQPNLAQWLWLVPLAIFSTATCSALQNWFIREKSFGLISKVRLGQAGFSSSFQIGAGLSGIGVIGLLFGYFVNSAVAVGMLGGRVASRCVDLRASLEMTNLRRLAHDYRRFPAFSTWEALANIAAIQIPVILIASKTGNETAGQLMLAMYVIQAPMGLIGGAISQVYLSQAPEQFRAGHLDRFTLEVLAKLSKVGIGPLMAIGILSPVVFGIIFGSEWDKAGYLVAWMTPWFILQFLASPVSMALHVTHNQRAAMLLQLFGLCLRVFTVLWAAVTMPESVGEVYAVSGFMLYAIYLWVVSVSLKIKLGRLIGVTVGYFRWFLPWIAGGLFLAAAIKFTTSILV